MKIDNLNILFAIALLSASLVCGVKFLAPIETQSTTHVYPDDFPGQTLQQAIWNETVNVGDEIDVKDNTYYMHLNVNKSITLRGFNRNTTILDGSRNGTVIEVNADNVRILEFTVQNGAPTGIYIKFASNCNVSCNVIKNNSYGVMLSYSSNCTLRDNDIKNNTCNFGVSGDTLEHYVHDIDVSNKVNGKPIYYWVDKKDEKVPASSGYVAIVNSTGITAESLSLQNNYQGILLAYVSNVTIFKNTVKNNYHGIYAMYSNNITVSGNYAEDNYDGITIWDSNNNTISDNYIESSSLGIGIWDSGNNTICDNVAINNEIAVELFYSNYNMFTGNSFEGGPHLFGVALYDSSGSTFCQNNFIGCEHPVDMNVELSFNTTWDNGREGNYWSTNINLTDDDLNGICDVAFTILQDTEEIDNCPLTEPWNRTKLRDVTFGNLPLSVPRWYLTTFSDHVVANASFEFHFSPLHGLEQITFNITAGREGFCNITIPRIRLDYPFNLTVDDTPTSFNLTCSGTHISLYFNYNQGTHRVKIIGTERGYIIGDVNGDGIVELKDFYWLSANFSNKEDKFDP